MLGIILCVYTLTWARTSSSPKCLVWIINYAITLTLRSYCVCGCMCVCVYALSHLLCPTLCNAMDCGQPGSSVHGILQARILEWIAMPSSQGTFPTQGSILSLLHFRQFLYHWTTEEAPWSPITIPHFTNEETKAQSNSRTCPISHKEVRDRAEIWTQTPESMLS